MKTLTERTKAALAWIDAQLAICSAATKGPWIRPSRFATHLYAEASMNHGKLICDCPDSSPRGEQHGPDADFIAAARTGYPAMLEGMKVSIAAFAETASFYQIPSHFSEKLESIITKIESLQ